MQSLAIPIRTTVRVARSSSHRAHNFPNVKQIHHALVKNTRSLSRRVERRLPDGSPDLVRATNEESAAPTEDTEKVAAGGRSDEEAIGALGKRNDGRGAIVWGLASAILPALGLIRLHEFVFPVLWGIYLFSANVVRFDGNKAFKDEPLENPLNEPWATPYAICAVLIAFVLPIITMLANYQNAPLLFTYASPLFLITLQVFYENLVRRVRAAVMVRMLVPIGFNAWRLGVVWEWFVHASVLGTWHVWLAGVNLAFWTWNLLVVLMLVMVPFYLDDRRCAT